MIDSAQAVLLRRAAMQAFEEGRLPEAEGELDRIAAGLAASLPVASSGRERRELAETLIDRATVRRFSNRPDAALADLEEAERLAAALLPLPRRTILTRVLSSRAGMLARSGADGCELARAQADAARLRELGVSGWMLDEIECNLALGRRDWRRAAELSLSVAGATAADGWPIGEAYARLRAANAWIEAGEIDRAAQEAAPAYEVFARAGPPDRLAAAELALARIAVARGEPERAWTHAERALAGSERLIRHFRSPDEQRRFVADKLEVYRVAFATALACPGTSATWRAWSVAERAKSAYLCQLVANADVGLFDGIPEDLAARLRAAESALDAVEAARAQAEGDPGGLERFAQRHAACVAEQDRLLAEAMRVNPRWAALRAPPPFDARAACETLPSEWSVLSWYWAPKAGGAVLHAFLRTPGSEPRRFEDAWSGDEVRALAAHRDRLDADGGCDPWLAAFPAAIAPKVIPAALAAAIPPDAPLLVSPHGVLADLAVHVLPVGDGRRLIERCPVQVVPTLALLDLRRPAPSARDVLVLGCAKDGFGFPPLEDVPGEVESVRGIWERRGAGVCAARVDAPATPASVGQPPESWSRFRVVHLACHGTFDPVNPLDAALLLGGDRVRAAKFFTVRLDAALVVLSACDVGRRSRRAEEREAGADEWAGLYLPLFYAGARALVASRWRANSEQAALFMASLHERLAAGAAPHEAMRAACLGLARGPEAFWANWALVGAPDGATPDVARRTG